MSTYTETSTEAMHRLLNDYWKVTTELVDVVEFATDDRPKRNRAIRALRINARTLSLVGFYLASPPNFSWFLHREPLSIGGQEWSIHT